ncbi:hypothetical protein OH77DRAFT_1525374 [Trametes cingulata]|nr:hypothetical protein OH77DRAFT_1525374 [Trametes cingulata]
MVKCANAKRVADPDIQECLDEKSGNEPSPARKQMKKPATIVVDEDDGSPTPPPSKSKGKAHTSGPSPQEKSTEKGKGAEKGSEKGAEKGSEKGAEKDVEPGMAAAADYCRCVRIALGTEGWWSTNPANLSDWELLEQLLVEGQQTRRAMEVLGQYLEHEVPIREALVQREILLLQATVKETVDTTLQRKTDSKVRAIVQEELNAAFEHYFLEVTEKAAEEDTEGAEEGQEEQEKAAEETEEGPEVPEVPELPELLEVLDDAEEVPEEGMGREEDGEDEGEGDGVEEGEGAGEGEGAE